MLNKITLYCNLEISFFSQAWNDARLTWTPSSYGNMNSTTMKMSDIWIPPLVLNNAYVTIMV